MSEIVKPGKKKGKILDSENAPPPKPKPVKKAPLPEYGNQDIIPGKTAPKQVLNPETLPKAPVPKPGAPNYVGPLAPRGGLPVGPPVPDAISPIDASGRLQLSASEAANRISRAGNVAGDVDWAARASGIQQEAAANAGKAARTPIPLGAPADMPVPKAPLQLTYIPQAPPTPMSTSASNPYLRNTNMNVHNQGFSGGKLIQRGFGALQMLGGANDMLRNGVGFGNTIEVGLGAGTIAGSPLAAAVGPLVAAQQVGQKVISPLREGMQAEKQQELVDIGQLDPTSPEAQQRMAELMWGHGMFGGNKASGPGHNMQALNYMNPNGATMTAAHRYDGTRTDLPPGMIAGVDPTQPYPEAMKTPLPEPAPAAVAVSTDQTSPIDITPAGKVVPLENYGMPGRPDMTRRSLAERFGDITGGAIPDTMEGFMVANFLQNQLRMDDSRRVGDNKDIYEADLGALPNFMEQENKRQLLPHQIDNEKAQSEAYRGQAARDKKAAEVMPSKEEGRMIEFQKRAAQDASAAAEAYFKNNNIIDATPDEVNAVKDYFYLSTMNAFEQGNKGKKARLTQRKPGEKKGFFDFFGEDKPPLPMGIVYE